MPRASRDSAYQRVAVSKGISWIGPLPGSEDEITEWECKCNNRWFTTLASIRASKGNCPQCARKASADKTRKKPDDYHALAKLKGFRWLGPEVSNNSQLTEWECGNGHKWKACYGNIHSNYGCPSCATIENANKRRKKPDDYHALADENGYKWLGPEVENSGTHTWWECPAGHKWESTYDNFHAGYGCNTCGFEAGASSRRTKEADYHALAEKNGYRWLGPFVDRIIYKTNWECPNGHTWNASYNNFSRDQRCPQCRDFVNGCPVSKGQRKIAEMVNGEINCRHGKYRIDVALLCNGEKIAIEYDSYYWHKGRDAEDAERAAILIADGWRVLRIKSGNLCPSENDLKVKIDELLSGNQYSEITLPDWGYSHGNKKTKIE